jgi:hypothetical protein
MRDAAASLLEPSARIDRLLAAERPATPCVVVDLERVAAQYRLLRHALPGGRIGTPEGRGLAIGDALDFLSARADTAGYASVEFNGFPPLPCHCI